MTENNKKKKKKNYGLPPPKAKPFEIFLGFAHGDGRLVSGWLNHPRGPWKWFGHPQGPKQIIFFSFFLFAMGWPNQPPWGGHGGWFGHPRPAKGVPESPLFFFFSIFE
jgi:hypothetical protein